MAQPFPPSPNSGKSGQGSAGSRSQPTSPLIDSATPQTPEQLLAALRTAIAAGELDLGSSLERIAVAAHGLTGADGAAVAMLQGGLVICRARSGTLAPQLGTPLSVDSGISGECLRTGQSMRCDDTNKDLRVDAEVCRRLGLRSIAVVPLRGTHRVVGILEAFSSRPHSFPDRHLEIMSELADLAVAARSAHQQKTRAAKSRTRSTKVVESRTSSFLPQVRLAASSTNRTLRRAMPVLGVFFAAIVVVALISLGWMFFRGRSAQSNPAPTTAHAAVKSSDSELPVASSASLVFNGAAADANPPVAHKPSPSIPARHSEGSDTPPAQVLERASQTEPLPAATVPEGPGAPVSNTVAANSNPTLSPSQKETDESAPSPASIAPPETSSLSAMLGASPDIPVSRPISQGISDGVLIHRVQPRYPEAARESRLQGRVVLQATITEEGTVRDLKVVSGPPVLARAAKDAVTQWRYRPYRLNGKPVSMLTEIKLDFILP
jgi:TonB family protein